MSELESFATTTVLLETFDDRNRNERRQSPNCYLTQIKYEYPDRAESSKTTFDERGLSAVSREQKLWIGERHYLQDDSQLWRLHDEGFIVSSETFLPFVMQFLLTEELPSEIETYLRLVGTELLDGVAVYHVRQVIVGRLPEFRNVASFWIGVEDLLLWRAHWERPAPRNHNYPDLGFRSELTEFHSFNEDFDIQVPLEDQIAE